MRKLIFGCLLVINLASCMPLSVDSDFISPTLAPVETNTNIPGFFLGKILYMTSGDSTNVFLSSPDASDTRLILSDVGVRLVSLAPDAKQVAYIIDDVIYIKNILNGQVRQLSTQHISGFFTGMEWSPDSKWIGFDCLIENISEICIVNMEDGSLKIITDATSFGAQFFDGAMFGSWNDDGSQIVYCLKVSSPQGGVSFTSFMLLSTLDNSSIQFMDDRNETEITNFGCPTLRPFVLSILFVAKQDGKYGIFSSDIDGLNVIRITSPTIKYDIHEPIVISPNGEYFFANSAKQNSDELIDVPTLFSSAGQIVFQLDLPDTKVVSWVNE